MLEYSTAIILMIVTSLLGFIGFFYVEIAFIAVILCVIAIMGIAINPEFIMGYAYNISTNTIVTITGTFNELRLIALIIIIICVTGLIISGYKRIGGR